jgi:tetratricopeptide (TPR) repeat protein
MTLVFGLFVVVLQLCACSTLNSSAPERKTNLNSRGLVFSEEAGLKFLGRFLEIDIDNGYSKEEVESAECRFRDMVQRLKQMVYPGMSDDDKISTIVSLMFAQESRIRMPETALWKRRLGEGVISNLLNRSEGDCFSVSILFLALARCVALPVYGVVVPSHFFVRYERDARRINLEMTSMGQHLPDEFYVQSYDVSESSIANGVYMRALSDDETAAQYLADQLYDIRPTTERSIARANSILDRYPHIIPALVLRAYFQGKNGDLESAEKDFRTCVALDPNFDEAHLKIALLIILKRDGMDKAMNYIRELRSKRPNSPALMLGEGYLLSAQGKFEKGLEFLRLAKEYCDKLEFADTVALMFLTTVTCCYTLNRHDEALETAQEFARLFPDDWRSKFALGFSYLGLKRYVKAIEALRDAMPPESMSEERKEIRRLLGTAVFERSKELIREYVKEKDAALLEKLDEATKQTLDYLDAVDTEAREDILINRGSVLVTKQKYDEAFEVYTKLQEYDAVESARGRALTKMQQGRYEEALKYTQEFHDMLPQESPDRAKAADDIKMLKELIEKESKPEK